MRKNIPKLISAICFFALLAGCCSLHRYHPTERVSTVTEADNTVITYGVRGKGDTTLVFIHCWTGNHELWRSQIDYFSQNYRVVWLDLAGHGLSGKIRKDYTMEAFGGDVATVVDEIGADHVILVGHSMGGPVALEAANLLSDKVIGIVGVDTFYTGWEAPKTEEAIAETMKPFKDNFTEAGQQMLNSMFTSDSDPALRTSVVNQLSTASHEMALSALHNILIWKNKKETSLLEKYAQKLRNINAAPTGKEVPLDKSVTLIQGVGHFIPQVKPEEFNITLNGIIKELSK